MTKILCHKIIIFLNSSPLCSELTPEQRNMDDAIIFFNIKDKSLFGTSECLAEAFLSFNDIPDYSGDETSLDTKLIKQIHLTLTRLQSDGK